MRNSKLRRDKRDHAALGANKSHADVHKRNITPAYGKRSTKTAKRSENISHDNGLVRDNAVMDQATRIRLARQRAALTQHQLAQKLGVRQSAVSQWEIGKVSPELATRIKLAEILRIPLSDVLPEAGDIPTDAFRDPQVMRLVERFVRLPPAARSAIELFVLDLEEKLRQSR